VDQCTLGRSLFLPVKLPLDLSVLPTASALTVFVCCFRPLVRRAGPHTNVWFAGWGFLLIHYMSLLCMGGHDRPRDRVLFLLATLAVEMCGLCFMLAASDARHTWMHRILIAEMGAPILLQTILYSFRVQSYALALAVNLLLVVPAVHLAILPLARSRRFNVLAAAFALLAAALIPLTGASPRIVQSAMLCALFLAVAFLTLVYAARITRGVGLMVGGLTLWGFSYLLHASVWLESNAHLNSAIVDLPRFIVAAGMILSLLDEYVGRTESLALHDPLTGLPNRRLFEDHLENAIEESTRTRTPIACLVIDVDNFKYINDNFGHPVGDGLLQALAKRLSWNLGPKDMLARTGGDEFTAVLVEAADEYHIRFIAGAMMAAGCVPVSIQQHSIDVRISIGIAVSPQDAGDGSELHKAADDAMYRAKRRGGSVIAFANEEVPQIHAV
jgi:diguanylate cyclase (GGDEF)-like protein